MNCLIKIFVLVAFFVFASKACDYTATIESQSDKDYFVQVKAPNDTTTEFLFKKRGQKEHVQITGFLCGLKMTTFSTYKANSDGSKGQRVQKSDASLDGMGMIHVSLFDNGKLSIDSRSGVVCSFSEICN